MKKLSLIVALVFIAACSRLLLQGGSATAYPPGLRTFKDSLYHIYSQSLAKWPKPLVDSSIAWTELGYVPPSPLEKPTPQEARRIALGNTLFFDTRLSGSAKLSCASCHLPELSWTDGRQKSLGHEDQPTRRNSPTLLNVWFYKSLFWDGRSSSLEDQAFSPINSAKEMHSSMGDVVRNLRKIEGYKPWFEEAFGVADISPETITQAIAAFERTLVSAPAAFDKFLAGDTKALMPSAIRGLHLFRTKAGCMNCHHGALLTDNSFHNTGLADAGGKNEDFGLYATTHVDEDAGKFKTPSLRDVMRTGPWMHNGLYNDMQQIIAGYAHGRRLRAPPAPNSLFQQPDTLLKPVALTAGDVQDVIAFLHAITAPPPVFTPSPLPK